MNSKGKSLIKSLMALLVFMCLPLLYLEYTYAEDGIEPFDASASGDNSVQVIFVPTDDEMYAVEVVGTGDMADYAMRYPWFSYRNKIKSIAVSSGITHVGDHAFARCPNLTTILLPEGLKSIGEGAFMNGGSVSVSIPKSVEFIKPLAFSGGDNTTEITINGSKTRFDGDYVTNPVANKVYAYGNSYIVNNWQESIVNGNGDIIQNTTELIVVDPFIYANPDDPTEITGYKSDASDIIIPDNILTIGEGAFADNSTLETINMNRVTTIKANAFKSCTELKKAFIYDTTETIEDGAFAGCVNLTIYGNENSEAYRYADANGIDFINMKPYLINQEDVPISVEIPVGNQYELNLSKYFAADYDTELTYEIKLGDSEFQALGNDKYSFEAKAEGVFTMSFRAKDSHNIPSEEYLPVTIKVITNAPPVLSDDKKEYHKIALFGEQYTVDLNGAFTDPDGDELTYKYLRKSDSMDWDNATSVNATNGSISLRAMQLSDLGKEFVLLVKAYDKWGKASDDAFTITVIMHSANIIVQKGEGVHSLDGLNFKFSRDGADDIISPAEIIDNNYYFDLDYVTRITDTTGELVYDGGYDYSYVITLNGCDTITGSHKFTRAKDSVANTIEAEFSNPAQAEADAKAVADLIKAIDNLGDIILDSEEAVNAAQAAYDALYDDLKTQVTNYNVLLEARLKIADLKLKKAEADIVELTTAKETAEGELQKAEDEKQAALDELNNVKAEIAASKLTVSGLKVTSKAKKFTITWKKNAKANGYQVQYKLKSAKTFKNLKKTTTKVSVKSKKLKKGKKYQFRVRPYKTINGNKIYGKWVSKTVKCK